MWNNSRYSNIHIIEIPEGDERDKGTETLFKEIMAENFPDLGKETDTQVQEAQRDSDKMNPKKPTPRYIVIKVAKAKEIILKKAGGKQ